MNIIDIVVLVLSFFVGWFVTNQGVKTGKRSVLGRLRIVKTAAFYEWIQSDSKLLERVNPEDLCQVDFENAIKHMDKDFFANLETEYANRHFYVFANLVNTYDVLESQCLPKG